MTVINATFSCALALVASAVCANAQAFGIEMGTSLGDLNIVEDDGNGYYTVTVPKPHPEFEFYQVKATSETGVCQVRGAGIDHNNDRYGSSVKRAFEDLKVILVRNYGPHYVGDYLEDGALWDDSNEWVMSIRQNERVYQAVWDREENSNLNSSLEEVILGVSALSSDKSYINLQYRFENHSACVDILRNESSDGL